MFSRGRQRVHWERIWEKVCQSWRIASPKQTENSGRGQCILQDVFIKSC